MIFGVDVHTEYQARLNIERLSAEGFSFCCVKATQGVSGYTAPAMFDDWIRRTRAAGMIPGAYHWLSNADGITQADRFLNRLAAVGGPKGMLLQIDNEDTTSPASADVLRKFVARMNARTGNHPLIMYTGNWWYQPHMGSFDAAALGLHLWDSKYVTGQGAATALYAGVQPSWWQPGYGGWNESTFLQFSSKGSAGGLVANVDVNAFQGTRADLLALTGTGGIDMDPNGHDIHPDLPNWQVLRDIWGATMADRFVDSEHRDDLDRFKNSHAAWRIREWVKADVKELLAANPAAAFTDAQVQQLAAALIAGNREAMISAVQEAERRGTAGTAPATG